MTNTAGLTYNVVLHLTDNLKSKSDPDRWYKAPDSQDHAAKHTQWYYKFTGGSEPDGTPRIDPQTGDGCITSKRGGVNSIHIDLANSPETQKFQMVGFNVMNVDGNHIEFGPGKSHDIDHSINSNKRVMVKHADKHSDEVLRYTVTVREMNPMIDEIKKRPLSENPDEQTEQIRQIKQMTMKLLRLYCDPGIVNEP